MQPAQRLLLFLEFRNKINPSRSAGSLAGWPAKLAKLEKPPAFPSWQSELIGQQQPAEARNGLQLIGCVVKGKMLKLRKAELAVSAIFSIKMAK